jgi:peroxiredoxin
MKFLFLWAAFFVLCGPVLSQTVVGSAARAEQPSFAAVDMEGNLVDSAELRGKVVVVNLWFINCPNCVQEIKMLNELVDEYKGNKDVVFVGLAASKKPELKKFLAKNPFKYQIVPDATMIILTKFGTPDKNGEINVPFPMHYVIDRDGLVAVKAQGVKGIGFVKNELKKQFPAKEASGN